MKRENRHGVESMRKETDVREMEETDWNLGVAQPGKMSDRGGVVLQPSEREINN